MRSCPGILPRGRDVGREEAALWGGGAVHVSTGPLGLMTLRRPNTLLWNALWSRPRLGRCNPTGLFFLILPGGKFQVCKPTVTWFGVLGFVPVPTEMFFLTKFWNTNH